MVYVADAGDENRESHWKAREEAERLKAERQRGTPASPESRARARDCIKGASKRRRRGILGDAGATATLAVLMDEKADPRSTLDAARLALQASGDLRERVDVTVRHVLPMVSFLTKSVLRPAPPSKVIDAVASKPQA